MKNSDAPEYVVRNYDAIDQQVAEIAAREREITNRIKIANYRRMAMIGIIVAAAISMIILAVGVALWLAKDSEKQAVTMPGEEHQVKVLVEAVPGTVIRNSNHTAPAQPATEPTEWRNSAPIGSSSISIDAIDRVDQALKSQNEGNTGSTETKNQPTTESSLTTPTRPNPGTGATSPSLAERSEIGRTLNSGARIHLLWEGFHDLDLFVIEPSGSSIYYGKKVGTSGGYLDIDRNVLGQSLVSKPVESISWTKDQLKTGQYKIAVSLYRLDPRTPTINGEIPFNVIIFRDGREEILSESISEDQLRIGKAVKIYEI